MQHCSRISIPIEDILRNLAYSRRTLSFFCCWDVSGLSPFYFSNMRITSSKTENYTNRHVGHPVFLLGTLLLVLF